ncbi:LamG-like jellyroll fold domain-containing protein [Streptomyces sp. NBC_01477]|uniref:LamG-like jellyroll fold domain-containing protein n=1 Tax=Streptomyces sp. NBC_01477 TaxID=2976015 RepID=UPI002E327F73|nr:LamG-like jellyroll fold domain-containing protein [Streptomyces sp. NBC_01477]
MAPDGPEQTAQQQAEQTGQPVVVDALTTTATETVAQPDGTFSLTSYTSPVRVRKNGSWTAVDPTLLANQDGTYSPAATPAGVALSGGGTGPLATLTDQSGHVLSYTFPYALPAPQVSGATALYPEVLPGVDLQTAVTDQGGFSEVLVVKDADAAADPRLLDLRLGTATTGLTLAADEAGNITAQAGDGDPAYVAPSPLMWDSSEGAAAQARTAAVAPAEAPGSSSASGPGPGAQVGQVDVSVSPDSVTLVPDTDVLRGPATTYPVYIDPFTNPVTDATGHYTVIQEGCPGASNYDSSQDNGEGVGYQQFASNCFGLERSYYEINTSNLDARMQFSTVTLHLTETYGSDHGCSNTWPVTLKSVNSISSATDWNHQPSGAATVATAEVKSAAASCGDRAVSFDVKSQIDAVAGVKDSWTFGLWGDESKTASNLGFMRFAVNPYITASFDIPPDAPSALSTTPNSSNPAGAACNSGNPGWIGKTSTLPNGTSNITLNAKLTTPMSGANVRGDSQVWDNQTDSGSGGPVTTNPPDTASVASGTTVHVPIGVAVKDGHQYGWGIRAYDGTLYGSWTSNCHFDVDLTPPTPAVFTDSAVFPPLGSGSAPTGHAGDTGVSVHVTSTDPTPSGCTLLACLSSGVRAFEYSLDTPVPPIGAHSVTATVGGDGTASANVPISLSAQQWGAHTLYVQAVDGAANGSPTTYSFYAPWNPATPVHPGDLDDDGVPDLISPAKDGNLYLTAGNSDVSAAPALASAKAQSPDGMSWNNYLVAHRGSTTQSGVDDLFAYNTQAHAMYIYRNDATTRTDGVAGRFTDQALGVVQLTQKPGCTPAPDCSSGYDPTWSSVTQILAPGSMRDLSPDLITVEKDGRLWFYPGTSTGSSHLGQPVLLGSGDWSGTELIAPGTVGSEPTLWARDSTGAVHTYPLAFGTDGLPVALLAAPAPRALTSLVPTGGTPLCADVRGSSTAPGTPVQTNACNSGTSQQWSLGSDGTVHALGGCLTEGGTASAASVTLDTCDRSSAQKWQPGDHGSLVNAASGLCLADPGGSTASGVQLIIWTCGSSADQNWSGTANGTLPTATALLPLGLGRGDLRTVASPGDVNSPAGSSDGNPDLYAVSPTGQYREYPGKAAVSGIAQFSAPTALGNLNNPADRWQLTNADDEFNSAGSLTLHAPAAFATDTVRGTVLGLNGTTGYAATGGPMVSTRKTASFTVSAWVKLNSLAANSTFISQSDTAGQANGFQLYYSSSAHAWAFNHANDDGTTGAISAAYGPSSGPNAAQTTVWTRLTGVYDGTTGTLILYVNGHLAATAAYTGTDWNAGGALQIGRRLYLGAYGEYANAALSDVELYSVPLTPEGVAALGSQPPIPTRLS